MWCERSDVGFSVVLAERYRISEWCDQSGIGFSGREQSGLEFQCGVCRTA